MEIGIMNRNRRELKAFADRAHGLMATLRNSVLTGEKCGRKIEALRYLCMPEFSSGFSSGFSRGLQSGVRRPTKLRCYA